jgi:hypothetical protein
VSDSIATLDTCSYLTDVIAAADVGAVGVPQDPNDSAKRAQTIGEHALLLMSHDARFLHLFWTVCNGDDQESGTPK